MVVAIVAVCVCVCVCAHTLSGKLNGRRAGRRMLQEKKMSSSNPKLKESLLKELGSQKF